MAKGQLGRKVARAASTGGGPKRKGQTPRSFQGAMAIIVVLGVLLVLYSRYEFQNGQLNASASTKSQPAVGTTWHVGLAVDLCGTIQPNLAASTNATGGLTTAGNGVITIKPKNASEAGPNATLGKFMSEYSLLSVTSQSLSVPGHSEYVNGDKCGSKVGKVQVKVWNNYLSDQVGHIYTGSPAKLLFEKNQLITVGFVANGQTVARPPSSVITALANANQVSSSSTATTTPALSPPTTAASTATTAAPVTTAAPATTAAPTTTSAKSGSSTTAPKSSTSKETTTTKAK